MISDYSSISDLNLGVLQDMDFSALIEVQEKMEQDWILTAQCDCVRHLKTGRVLDCVHLNEAISERTKDIRRRIATRFYVDVARTITKLEGGET